MNTTEIGDKSEAVILAELVKRDFRVLLPFGNNRRYDLVLEDEGQFRTVQVKTGKLVNGCVLFKTDNRSGNYRDIDLFAVYCPDNQGVYLVPTDRVGKSHGYLRISSPKNGQKKDIVWASEFVM